MREPITVAFDGLVQVKSFDLVEHGQIRIKHDFFTSDSDNVDLAFNQLHYDIGRPLLPRCGRSDRVLKASAHSSTV